MQPDQKLATQCPHCLKRFAVRPELMGKRVKCAACRQPFEIVEMAKTQAAPPRAENLSGRPASRSSTARVVPDEAIGMAPPLAPPPKPSVRPVWLELKWIGAAAAAVVVLVVGLLYLGGVFSSKSDALLTQDQRQPAPSRRTPPSAASADDDSRAQQPAARPGAAVPALTWASDDIGRQVGTATAAVRSAATQVRVVLPPGDHPAGSLPCVFVCPAGSNLLTGVPWGDNEQRDFYGLLERGLAVCFYSLDGTVADYNKAGDLTMAMKMQSYLKSGGGVANLQDAIEAVLAGAPAIDPKRLGAIGHSSAGTVALAGAGADPRIIAVAAMAPAIDLPKRLAAVVEQLPADLTRQIYRMSPSSIQTLTADVLIIQADDDTNSPAADARDFAGKHSTKVKLQRLAAGGHGGAYTKGMAPAMDFLAAKLGAKPIPGAGKVNAASVPSPAIAPGQTTPRAQRPMADADQQKPQINEAYWYKPRTNGVSFQGAGSILLVADWPKGYGAGGDRRGATLSILRLGSVKTSLGIRVLVAPDAGSPRLVAGQGLLPQGDGNIGIDTVHARIVLTKSEPKVLPAMGGGRIALFECGEDTELGIPTREAVIALEYEGKVVLIHLAAPPRGPMNSTNSSPASESGPCAAKRNPRPYRM